MKVLNGRIEKFILHLLALSRIILPFSSKRENSQKKHGKNFESSLLIYYAHSTRLKASKKQKGSSGLCGMVNGTYHVPSNDKNIQISVWLQGALGVIAPPSRIELPFSKECQN